MPMASPLHAVIDTVGAGTWTENGSLTVKLPHDIHDASAYAPTMAQVNPLVCFMVSPA